MSDELEPDEVMEGEVVDALPVLAKARPLPAAERAAGPPAPAPAARQAAVVAATGFVAGAATVAVLHRRRARRAVAAGRGRRGAKRGGEALAVAATRSFLVDVHLLGARPTR